MTQFQLELPSSQSLQSKLNGRTPIVLYDQNLLRYPRTANWLSSFKIGFSLFPGEELKNIEHWPQFLKKFLAHTKGLSAQEIVLIAVGGGSVGDFVGFLASVLKRGVTLWHVPSTWLAAIDSAHGGKTGMNLGPFKNQIGTFYPAEETFVCQEILETQPEELKLAAFGELVKIAIISGGELLAKLPAENFWELLPQAIEAKMKIVKQDPLEMKGVRSILNLGHTLGHALELHHGVPHGHAVLLGLDFALEWSRERGLLSAAEAKKLLGLSKPKQLPKIKLNRGKLREAVLHDKKARGGDRVNFVFVQGAGKPVLETVSINDFLNEADRQGWTHG